MRLSAYKKLVESALELPDRLEGATYFKSMKEINPQSDAIYKILNNARLDTNALFNSEFIELYNYVKQQRHK